MSRNARRVLGWCTRLKGDHFLYRWMVVWVLAVLWGEAGVFWYKRCAWAADDGGAAGAGIVVMADIQLMDHSTYSFAPRGSMLLMLAELVNDAFLRRAFRFVVRPLGAAAHIYAGDLFDNLRAADDATRQQYVRRFESITALALGVASSTDETPSLVVEGNHDVGLRKAYSPAAQAWFASHFLNRTHRVHRTVAADIVMVNAPALVSLPRSHPEVVASLQAAADPSSCRPEVACILVSHIPLWRDAGEGCNGAHGGAGHDWRARGGGNRGIIDVEGYGYLNLLPDDLSNEILWAPTGGKGRWDAVLSGDDHSWCVHTHHRPASADLQLHTDRANEVVEFTVGTMSWLQGATSSWVLLLQCRLPTADRQGPVVREGQSSAGGAGGGWGSGGGGGSAWGRELADVQFGRGAKCVARPCALPKERHVLYSYCGLAVLTVFGCIARMAWDSAYGLRRGLAALVGECARRVAVLLVWALSLWALLLCLV